jgi:outer membrane PBP1 activator LpoA protein
MRCHHGIVPLTGRLTTVALAIALTGCQTNGPATPSSSLGMERSRPSESSAQRPNRTQMTQRSRNKNKDERAATSPHHIGGGMAEVIMGVGF